MSSPEDLDALRTELQSLVGADTTLQDFQKHLKRWAEAAGHSKEPGFLTKDGALLSQGTLAQAGHLALKFMRRGSAYQLDFLWPCCQNRSESSENPGDMFGATCKPAPPTN